MVYRGRSVVTSGYSARSSARAASVPFVEIDEGYGYGHYEPYHHHRVHHISTPRIRHEHIDLSMARQPDSKFYNDVNARMAAIGPEPLLINPYHAASYSSAAPALSYHYSSPVAHKTSHHHVSHHVPVAETVSKRRTWTTAAAPSHRRSDMDAEVAAYLAYTPSHHHYYTHRHASSSFAPRSRSSPPIYRTLSHPPSISSSLTPFPSYSSHSVSTPSYMTQFYHSPLSGTYNAGSSNVDYASYSPPVSHYVAPLSTYPTVPSFEHYGYSPSIQHTLSTPISEPVSSGHDFLNYDYTTPHLSPRQHHFSISLHSDCQPYAVSGSHGSSVVRELPPRPMGRSLSRHVRDTRSVVDIFGPPSTYRAVSVDSGKPLVNFKEVKPPMSETRKKVRDLICRTRKDPTYYK